MGDGGGGGGKCQTIYWCCPHPNAWKNFSALQCPAERQQILQGMDVIHQVFPMGWSLVAAVSSG